MSDMKVIFDIKKNVWFDHFCFILLKISIVVIESRCRIAILKLIQYVIPCSQT